MTMQPAVGSLAVRSRSGRRKPGALPLFVASAAAAVTFFAATREARAVPSFARKYQTGCQTCHTVYPMLNPFGEAFRRNGYRFPSRNGGVDSDSEKSPMLQLGQEEYKKTFPNSVWPGKIPESIPLGVMFNGSVPVNLPGSEAKDQAGNTFTWGGIAAEVHLFGAGALSDTLTYFTQVTIADSVDIETAYLLWNDIVGPSHAVNLWVGRLFAPQLTSFGLHSSYLSDTMMPAVSVAGLYNPSGTFTLGQGHTDGAELNGTLAHRFDYAIGWVASSNASGLSMPNAEDAYAHIGVKIGGVSFDGEGEGSGTGVPDPLKPWAERSITFDVFGYHGMANLDNGTGVVSPTMQRDRFNALGAALRVHFDSLMFTAGGQAEFHQSPYQGSAAAAGVAGAPNTDSARAFVQYDELDYVIFPWLVPGVRAEITQTTVDGGDAGTLIRLIPGIALLPRSNFRLILTGDIERATGLPTTGSWAAAGGFVSPPLVGTPPSANGQRSNFKAEQIQLTAGVSY